MTEHVAKSFSRKQVKLGSDTFRNCTFTDCEIEFTGGEPKLEGCSFTDCTWTTDGAASQTLAWFHALYMDPAFRFLAEDAIEQIRHGLRRPN